MKVYPHVTGTKWQLLPGLFGALWTDHDQPEMAEKAKAFGYLATFQYCGVTVYWDPKDLMGSGHPC